MQPSTHLGSYASGLDGSRQKPLQTARVVIIATASALVLCSASAADVFEQLSCDEIVRNGWDKMPDVAEYILAKPGADKLGYGSECHLGSLVFAQCFLEPKWSVKKAIDVQIRKAAGCKRLPDTPVCEA